MQQQSCYGKVLSVFILPTMDFEFLEGKNHEYEEAHVVQDKLGLFYGPHREDP